MIWLNAFRGVVRLSANSEHTVNMQAHVGFGESKTTALSLLKTLLFL
jgi:hypothetical protein